jgi:hypothetical protein
MSLSTRDRILLWQSFSLSTCNWKLSDFFHQKYRGSGLACRLTFCQLQTTQIKSPCADSGTESQLLMLTTTSSNGFSDTNITGTYCSSSSISRIWLHCK